MGWYSAELKIALIHWDGRTRLTNTREWEITEPPTKSSVTISQRDMDMLVSMARKGALNSGDPDLAREILDEIVTRAKG